VTTTLVVGKFLPPHAGHSSVIAAASDADGSRCHVVVCAAPTDAIPATQRAEWIRRSHPDVNVVVVDDICGHLSDTCEPECSLAWAELVREVLGERIDAVYSSEGYGAPFADALGARHHPVNPERRTHPVSGTAVRLDPYAQWEHLAPWVRAHYVVRVAVVGAESTGTTTLARELAGHYDTLWVPEYGRAYSEAKMAEGTYDTWTSRDFEIIAAAQQANEDALAEKVAREPLRPGLRPLLICDTDALATTIWERRYLGRTTPAVQAIADARTYAMYILTDFDIPFVDDGTRDGEHLRGEMTEHFQVALEARSEPSIVVRGPRRERLSVATATIDRLLQRDVPVPAP